MLFGALLIAPASTFVGCSDYDDDISSLQQQIDVNKSTLNDLLAEKVNDIQSQLEALKKADSDLDAAFKDADAALKQAQEAGDKAVLDKVASEYATVAAAKELVANAKDELQKALDSKAEELIAKDAELTEGVSAAKAAAAAAQATADQALALAQEASDLAQKNADAIKAVNGELDTQAAKLEDLSSKLDAQATKLGELSTKIDEVKSSLEAQISSLSDEINGKLDEVNSKISAINGQIAALEAFKTAQEGTNTDLQNQIDALVEELNGVKGYLEGKLRVQIEGMIGDAEARIMESVDATNTTIANLKTAYDEEFRQLKARMDAVEAAIDELNDTTIPGINTRIDNLNTDINTLKATLSNVLRSIVFKPELYVGGIESQEYGYMHYNHLTTGAAAAQTGTMDNGASFTITTPRSEWDFVTNVYSEKNVAPAIAVKYHLNPSNAEVPAAKLAFISQNAQIINRASNEAPMFAAQYYNDINDKAATVYSPVAQNGVLTVGMEVNADKLHALYNGGGANVKQGSIFALQATVAPDGKDQLITSDYAQLYTSQIKPFAIAFNNNSFNTTNTCTAELYKDAATALTKVASHAINYKDYVAGKGIDLAKLFDIHYSWTSETNKNTAHAILENGAEKKFGLSYDFKLIDYTAGTNQTSDSKYAEITSNNELLVRRVDANGNTVAPTSDAEARAAIGRRPLVRVRVMEGSKVVLVGFFHLQIVEEAASKVTTAYNFGEQQWTCAGYTGKVTWSHVSDAVLSACGLSSDEFESLYTLTLNGAHAEQYTVTTSPVSGTPVTTPRLGQVVKVTETVGGVTTSVLKWTLTGKELQSIYDKNGHTATIYVQFHRNSANANSLEGHIYFPLTITVTKPAIPTVSAKGNENWADNVFAINVGQPRPGGALTKITDYATTVLNNGENKILWSDLDYAWQNGKPSWTGTSGYYVSHTTSTTGNGNGANTGYKYYFVPESNGFIYKAGTTVVTPSNLPASAQDLMDNKLVSGNYKYKYSDAIFCCNEIYSGSDLICTLNQTNGQVVWNTSNNKAKEILNKNAETIFKVGMVTQHVSCDVALPLNYDGSLAMFNFKVQRPVNVDIVGGPAEVIDAETTTYDIPLANYLQFTDWRNVNFWNDLHLFYFYEIKDINIDTPNIETNVNGSRQKLSVAKPEVQINLVGVNLPVVSSTPSRPALEGKLGTITYRTNTGASVVNGYEIYVPIYVTYGLSAGTGDKSLKTELVIKVKPSYQ
ncbi:MAG: hypothetical protein PUB53_05920 [Bacteroidales bacterium]|nr:hypothetical protein [Bacteroidales bacterium]